MIPSIKKEGIINEKFNIISDSKFFLLLGFDSMLTPSPGGSIMIAGSITNLICTSPRARFCVEYLRQRLNWFNKIMFLLESKVGSRISTIGDTLSQTKPEPTDYCSFKNREERQ